MSELRHRNAPSNHQNSPLNSESIPTGDQNIPQNASETPIPSSGLQTPRISHEETLSNRKKYLEWVIGVFAILYSILYLHKNEENNVNISSVLTFVIDNTINYEDSIKLNLDYPVYMVSSLKISGEEVTDKLFKVSVPCVRLQRNVQMYQWEEHTTTHSDDEGNSFTETYHTKTWSSYRLHTTSFFYNNPDFDVESKIFVTNRTELDNGLRLSGVFYDQINWKVQKTGPTFENWNYYSRKLVSETRNNMIPEVGEATKRTGNWLWDNYKIGDYRIYWECLGAQGDKVSVLGKISKNHQDNVKIVEKFSIEKKLPAIALVERGDFEKIRLINRAFRVHKRTSWWYRFLLTLLTMFGVVLIWEVVLKFCGNVYFLRNMMRGRAGVVMFAGFIAITNSIIVVSACWFKVRPVLSFCGILMATFPWINVFVTFRRSRGNE